MDLIITILPVVTKDLPISPRFTPYDFLSRCKFSTLTTRQPMAEIYLLAFPRFPLRKKEHKSYFGKNRTHDFRTSRCAGYLLDHTEQVNHFFPYPPSRLRVWSLEAGSAFPSRVSPLILPTLSESSIINHQSSIINLVLTHGIPPEFRGGGHFLYRQPPSGQSRVYQVRYLRTDDVQSREPAGTGPVVLEIVPVTGAAFAGHHGPINTRLSFPTPTNIGMK